LASAALVGIAPESFLRTDDALELQCLFLVAEQAIEYRQIEMQNQAVLIINYLGKALGSDK
jgi:hypothetical protein